jgi:HSP20 family protein
MKGGEIIMANSNMAPRDMWSFPAFRTPSVFNDLEEMLSMTDNAAEGLSVSEDDKNVYVEAAIPGIDPDRVEVTFDRGMLWIRGEAQDEERDRKRKFYRRAAQAFSYRVAIPAEVDQNTQPKAEYTNGMIRVTFAKKQQTQPQKLTVKVDGGNIGKRKEK